MTDDKDATPLDMGGLQTRLDGRGAAQVRREPPFDGHDDAGDDEVQNEVDQAGDNEDLNCAEALRDQFGGQAGHFHHGDDRRERCRLHHQNDLAAIGGDEFGIILVEPMRLEHSIRYAERVIKRLRQPFSYAGRKLIIKGSIGVTAFPDHQADPMDLMKAADIALYRAKAQGRNRVVVYTPEMGQEIEDQAVLRQQVRKALLREQFLPHYQPKIDLASGRIVGFEALARWEHPSRGILTPAAFSAAFADPELGVALGKQIISRAAQDMRQWLDTGIDFGRIAVNLSSAEFNRPHLAEEVLSLLDAAKVPSDRLEVEITETVLLGRSAEYAGTILRMLCERGVRIALDDFGTGYASLTHLKQFPVDHVKIDRSFVRDLEEDADDAAIVAAVINLGHSLNLAITAEGVETPGQALRLRALGCHNAQGFLYSQAMTASEVAEFIINWSSWESKSSG